MNSTKRHMIGSACFDLECSSLQADFGIILAAVIKTPFNKPMIFRSDKLNPKWAKARSDDSAIVSAVADELRKYDILVAHNGVDFDLPFLRTRLMIHKLPPLPDFKIVDPVKIARKNLRLSSNRLVRIASMLGVNHKKIVEGPVWMRAILDGDRKAMDQIADKCVSDVETLEAIIDYLKPYTSMFNSWGSA